MATPGLLFVYMTPGADLSPDQFHDWYNNEHGPLRLRLPHIFPNGIRWRATNGTNPPFVAIYDVTDTNYLVAPIYTSLREQRSQREAEVIGQINVGRYFFDLVCSQQSPDFKPIESLSEAESDGIELVVLETDPKDVEGAEENIIKWFQEEHIGMLSKVPGWLRSRLFRTSKVDDTGTSRLLSLHEYAKVNGLGGPEHKASMDTPWRTEVAEKYIGQKSRKTYTHFYTFGPAPRDITSPSRLAAGLDFSAPDGTTKTVSGPSATVSSYVSASDSTSLPFILEGNPDPKAPVIAFSNSLLTSLHMWDPLLTHLKAARPDLRILRYDTRGRHTIAQPPVPATMDMLADDLLTILDALRIEKLHALIGVSMGGATTLNFALRYPDRLSRFIACDFNAVSAAANTQAWRDRIVVAESDNGAGIKSLAEVTVARWFHPTTMTKPEIANAMIDMVASNTVEGFKYSCQALWDYDLKPGMQACNVPGLFVVGDGDGRGAVVKAMQSFNGLLGSGNAEVRLVAESGHLPMFETPEAFWETIRDFL